MTKFLFAAVAAVALLCGATSAKAQATGTAAEAKAMLEKATASLKANEADALAKFARKDGGFVDRDLYVFCFSMTDGKFTAHINPSLMGTDVRNLKSGDDPLGQRIFDTVKNSAPGSVVTIDYKFPKPGTTEPLPKQSFLTRVGNQGCGCGYYK
jgi:cytochrome c